MENELEDSEKGPTDRGIGGGRFSDCLCYVLRSLHSAYIFLVVARLNSAQQVAACDDTSTCQHDSRVLKVRLILCQISARHTAFGLK